jgi:hypothetical protein
MSQRILGKATNVSGSLVGHYERAERTPSKKWVVRADEALEARGQLLDLWPEVLRDSYPAYAGTFMEAVPQASLMRDYHPLLIPGLIQTEGYARALLRASNPMETEDYVCSLVEKRMQRQELINESDTPIIWVIITENVIRALEGDPEVLAEQLDHLLALMGTGRVRLQVIPATVRFRDHPGLDGPFTILSLPDHREVAYVEGPGSGSLISDAKPVEKLSLKFGILQSVALAPEQTKEFLKKVRGQVDGHQKVAQVELQQWGRRALRGGNGDSADDQGA